MQHSYPTCDFALCYNNGTKIMLIYKIAAGLQWTHLKDISVNEDMDLHIIHLILILGITIT